MQVEKSRPLPVETPLKKDQTNKQLAERVVEIISLTWAALNTQNTQNAPS